MQVFRLYQNFRYENRMFRPVRTLLFIFLAFVVGVFYERNQQAKKCLDRGGRMVDGICYGDS